MTSKETNSRSWTTEELIILGSFASRPERLIKELPNRTPTAIRFKLARLIKKGEIDGDASVLDSIIERERSEGKSTGSVDVRGLKTEVKTLQDLVNVCEIDLNEWSVDRWSCKAYGGFLKDADKKPVKVQLFSVSAKLVRRKADDPASDFASIIEEMKNFAPVYPTVSRPTNIRYSRRLLELSIPDIHVGKLAWGEECGVDYDSDIAESLYIEAIEDLIAKTYCIGFDEILLVVGNDLLNTDNSENTTTAGTPQDCDTRHLKMFRRVRLMLQKVIERLILCAPKVVVLICPGNHDRSSCFALGEALDAWFHRTPEVEIITTPKLRKFYRFGKVLLGFTHGNEEKADKLPMIMAVEEPELWGETKFREIHTGHFHQKKSTSFVGVGEHNGVVVRILPSLCAPEAWHVAKGYVGNVRSAEAYVWDSEEGLVGTAVFNAPITRERLVA